MKKGNRLIRITVIISILLSMLVGRVKSSKNEKEKERELSNVNSIYYNYIPSCTIKSESEKQALENYAEEGVRYIFIKNLLINNDNDYNPNSENTEDVLVIENKNMGARFSLSDSNCVSYMYTCLYKEVEENGIKKKQYIPHKEATGEEKKILIVSNRIDNKFIAQIKEAKNRLTNLKDSKKIKLAIKLMKRVLNQMLCQFDNDNSVFRKHISNMLEEMEMTDTTAYALYSRKTEFNRQSNYETLFRHFKSKLNDIKKLVDKHNLYTIITENNQQEIKDVFTKDTSKITINIMDRKQNYKGKTVDELRNESIEGIRMFINVLANKKIENNQTCIDKEQLKKEKEKKDRLIEAVDRCQLIINELRNKINNSENLSCSIKSEPSTEVEKEANEIFNQMIDSENIEINLNLYGLIIETKPWNKDLVKLLHSILEKYNKFNGTAEEIIAEIPASNAQIASEFLNNREKEYQYYRNKFVIRKTIKNELTQIMNILEKKQNVVNSLRKKITKDEKEHIINILESIPNELNAVTKEEQIIREALEYISLGKDNPEEEQRIRKLLHNPLITRKTPEEQNKPQEKDTRDIRTILSEIAQEYIRLESFKAIDKQINHKKQEIVNILVKKLAIESEIKWILKEKKDLIEVVESIVDILIDETVNHAQYKGFISVKEELKEEEEYIRRQGQDLINTFNAVFAFIEKYGYLVNFRNP